MQLVLSFFFFAPVQVQEEEAQIQVQLGIFEAVISASDSESQLRAEEEGHKTNEHLYYFVLQSQPCRLLSKQSIYDI